ncbi:hypothetical protein SALBM135S_04342 [Streptomyces alboniger]
MATGALSAQAASARPYPEPSMTTMSLPSPPGGANVKVLVFHGSAAGGDESPVVNAGIEAIEKIGLTGPAAQRFKIVATDDAAVFTNEKRLGTFNAVAFLTGGGDVLDAEQEAGLEAYMEAGGGFLGIHDAARAEPYSSWFTGLIGARPADAGPTGVQRATVEVGDREHPATKDLPLEWKRPDKWLNWTKNPSGTCIRSPAYRRRPTSRARARTAGTTPCRGAATTTAAAPSTPAWAARPPRTTRRTSAATCAAPCCGPPASHGPTASRRSPPTTRPNASPRPTSRARTTRSASPTAWSPPPTARSSTSAAAAPTSQPVITDWNNPDIGKGTGEIHVYDPKTRKSTLAGALTVFGNKGGGDELIKVEEGLLGIELDPRFERNGWVYLHYTPHSKINRETHMAGSGTSPASPMTPPTAKLDMGSEKVLPSWPVQIHSCCHAGGGMAWDSKDNLYIATR